MITRAGQVYDGGPQAGRPPVRQHRLEVRLLGHVRQQSGTVSAERRLEPALQQCVLLVPLLLLCADADKTGFIWYMSAMDGYLMIKHINTVQTIICMNDA